MKKSIFVNLVVTVGLLLVTSSTLASTACSTTTSSSGKTMTCTTTATSTADCESQAQIYNGLYTAFSLSSTTYPTNSGKCKFVMQQVAV